MKHNLCKRNKVCDRQMFAASLQMLNEETIVKVCNGWNKMFLVYLIERLHVVLVVLILALPEVTEQTRHFFYVTVTLCIKHYICQKMLLIS